MEESRGFVGANGDDGGEDALEARTQRHHRLFLPRDTKECQLRILGRAAMEVSPCFQWRHRFFFASQNSFNVFFKNILTLLVQKGY